MNTGEQNKIKALKQFFAISVAVFEMQHNISKALGYLGRKSHMYALHLNAQEELNKESPDLKKIDKFLAMMEKVAKDNSNNNNRQHEDNR